MKYPSKLSIIIPVYNEVNTILQVLQRIKDVQLSVEKEIIVVDDYSTDGTREILKKIDEPMVKIVYHSKNQGKGAAIKTAQGILTGDIVIIQDADLECQPEDHPRLIKPIIDGRADVVYGSRFLGSRRIFSLKSYLANRFLTLITNFLYNVRLSDMETGFKVFKTTVFKKIHIKARRFDFEPEITAKICKQNLKVVEMPITPGRPRSYQEGKKIGWRDAICAIWTLLKYRFLN